MNNTGHNSMPDQRMLALYALKAAQGQIGQTESPKGSNRGEMINKYLRSVGLNPGYAWCQAFVYWCYEEAAKQIGIRNPMPKTAGVYDCWNRCAIEVKGQATSVLTMLRESVARQPEVLQPGDQFILTFGKLSGHTGIIERVAIEVGEDPVLHTIEGNSNTDGSREGYAVVRHKRKLSEKALRGFIRYA